MYDFVSGPLVWIAFSVRRRAGLSVRDDAEIS
jgi:hypothetical protein